MRRNKTQQRGSGHSIRFTRLRLVQVLAVGGIGYLIGGWNVAALRSPKLSATEAVALRFPDAWNNVAPMTAVPIAAAETKSMTDDGQLALLNPEPMIPQATIPQATLLPPDRQATSDLIPQGPTQAAAQPGVRPVAAKQGDASTSADSSAPVRAPRPPAAAPDATAQPRSAAKMAAPVVRRHTVADRPGYMLNDAQIASIKARLNLTPDQEQMWPAVEAALRNIAYTHTQQARGRAGPANTAQAAAVDPDAVQGLKSAAVPLIMSFNSEQKEEVRNLAHVMGLDQLASEF